MKERIICKGLAVAVILLFIGVGVQPAFATVQQEVDVDVEPKDYLFHTIIDIANNPDIKELFEQYSYDLFKVDIDRSIYSKIFLRNPRLMFNTLFTKPTMTFEYLDKCYNNGIEITNILGEDKALEMMESIEVTDTKFLDKLNNIFMKDEQLSGRLAMLKYMNNELNSYTDYWDNPFYCLFVLVMAVAVAFIWGFFYLIYDVFTLHIFPIISYIFQLILQPFDTLISIFVGILYSDCDVVEPLMLE